jgi:phenylacetate-CoA ligase
MMELCATAHPHYSRVMAEQGLSPSDFSTVDDLHKLPPLPKQRFIEEPEAFRLQLDDVPGLSTEEMTLADIIYTAGSTSKPTPFYDTVHDRFGRIHLLKRATTVAGIGPDDIVMNLFPVSSVPHQGFLSASWGAMAVGAKLLTGLTGRPYEAFPVHNRMDHAIEMIERERATVIWGITAYVRRLVVRAQEQGRDFGSVRLAMVMGEACPTGMREDIKTRLISMGSDDPWTNNGYGLTETLGPATQCFEGGGMHQPLAEDYYFEVVDPETYEPVPDGKPGMMLVSHLNRRGTVLLRYVSGDIVSITHETCPDCGRTSPQFMGAPYRADGLTKVKGTLINPASLNEEMTHLLQRGVAEYQVVIGREDSKDPYSGDMLLVRVAAADRDRDRLRAEVVSTVTHSVEITPQVEFLPKDGFAEIAGGYKFNRFVDER